MQYTALLRLKGWMRVMEKKTGEIQLFLHDGETLYEIQPEEKL